MLSKLASASLTRSRSRYLSSTSNRSRIGGVFYALSGALGLSALAASFEPSRNFLVNMYRMTRTLVVCAAVSADYKFSFIGLDGHELEKQYSIVHKRSAQTLMELFKKQGGLYVKCGQHLTSMYYLLPEEYCSTMRELTNRAAFVSYKAIAPVFKEEIGMSPKEFFDEFDETPIAAASIAQVHKAYKDGQCYAVKIQLPDVQKHSAYDIKTLRVVTAIVSTLFPNFKLKWLAREIEGNLPEELDFMKEASNTLRVAKHFKSDLNFATPKVLHASKRVLVMEFIDGIQLDDVEGIESLGLNTRDVAKHLNRIFNEQIFVHRFVHCDPHSGNVIIRRAPHDPTQPQVCLIDNGLYREYSKEFSKQYAQLWLSILTFDEEKIGLASKDLGIQDYRLFASILTARPWEGIRSNPMERTQKAEILHIKQQASSRTSDITNVLELVPSHVLLLLKTNDLLRIANNFLKNSSMASMREILKFSINSVHGKLDIKKLGYWEYLKRANARFSLYLKLFILEYLHPFISTFVEYKKLWKSLYFKRLLFLMNNLENKS